MYLVILMYYLKVLLKIPNVFLSHDRFCSFKNFLSYNVFLICKKFEKCKNL